MPAQIGIQCRYCGETTEITFGPFGFISQCRTGCQSENLDLEMEPMWFAELTILPKPDPTPEKYVTAA